MPCSKVSINKNYKSDKAGCTCIPTAGKSCICVCENENGDIVRCDDCKCFNSDTCQCKCDDSKCTCVTTKGADCVCICRYGRGNFKACDSSCNEGKNTTCCKKEVNAKSCECFSKKPEKQACGSSCNCDGKRDFIESRGDVTVSKNYKCDKAGCVCIPTGGKSCICVCENETGDIVRCDDCKCFNSDTCQCKCDDSKCICITTKGADCVCICRDGRGNFKACDCSCNEGKNTTCCKKEVNAKSCECFSKKPEKQVCGSSYNCDGKRDYIESRGDVTVSKNYKCDKAGCVCIPTGGKSCICLCENETGDIVRCDDCKCFNSDTCQCKCDDSKCICITTKGADCVCVCRDARGNFKACDCSCNEGKNTTCCKKEVNAKSCECFSKKPEKQVCGSSYNCDGKRYLKDRGAITVSKNYKCDKEGCDCILTGRKLCICVCENETRDIIKCNDCKCFNSGTCQFKCDDSKCTCIVTKGADCVCVCCDGRGTFKACDCSCIGAKYASCCKEEINEKPYGCCSNKLATQACSSHCKCDDKRDVKEFRRVVSVSKNYQCNKAGCVCIPTAGKSCICVCENENGDIVRCDSCKCFNFDTCQCKCDDSKCTCITTKGADCVCVYQDGRGNFKACGCSCIEAKSASCCKKEIREKPYGCCSKRPATQACSSHCKCDGKSDFKESRRVVSVSKNYKCDKAGCVCVPSSNTFQCGDCKCCSGKYRCKKPASNNEQDGDSVNQSWTTSHTFPLLVLSVGAG